jgi:hypothetical protein
MGPIQVKRLDYDLTPTAGLALVGHFLKTLAPVLADVDAALPVRTGVATSDIVRSDPGSLVQGRSDVDAIEDLRGDRFFKQAPGIGLLPSSPTLRQRMDAHAAPLAGQVMATIEQLLARHAHDYGVPPCGWLPLDIDTFAHQGCRPPPAAETTAAPSRKAWAAPAPASTAAVRRLPTCARTASAWTWCWGPAPSTRPSTPTTTCAASCRWHGLGAPAHPQARGRPGADRRIAGRAAPRAPRAEAGRAHHRLARPAPDPARIRTRRLDDDAAGAHRCPAGDRALCRPRHARAVPCRVQANSDAMARLRRQYMRMGSRFAGRGHAVGIECRPVAMVVTDSGCRHRAIPSCSLDYAAPATSSGGHCGFAR